jgi:hypothetical protein
MHQYSLFSGVSKHILVGTLLKYTRPISIVSIDAFSDYAKTLLLDLDCDPIKIQIVNQRSEEEYLGQHAESAPVQNHFL